eukprot:COSAG01_NODE_38120_length_494_cov_0.645570_1_plen_90_part_00
MYQTFDAEVAAEAEAAIIGTVYYKEMEALSANVADFSTKYTVSDCYYDYRIGLIHWGARNRSSSRTPVCTICVAKVRCCTIAGFAQCAS